MADEAWCRLCFNMDVTFSPIEGKLLDLVTFTLGKLALSISPSLTLPPPLLCRACEVSMSEFKLFKVTVQTNIQLLIDNKESIQKHGMGSLELKSRGRHWEEEKSTKEEVIGDLSVEEETDAIELNEIFDKEHILEVKEEYIASDGNKNQNDKYNYNDLNVVKIETERKARRRRYKAKPGSCVACQR